MPTITLNKDVLLKRIGKKVSDDKLKYYISYLGTDLDGIDGNEITVEVFPNRPDLLSEQGFARALATFIGTKKGISKFDVKPSGEELIIEPSVSKYRPYTACAIVKGLKLNDEKIIELINIQEKLTLTYGRNRDKMALGIYPMEKIKFPIYYRALPPNKIKFQPLEMPKELTAMQIASQHPKGRDYFHLVEKHDKFTLFMDSENKVLSWTPLINSHGVGKITEKTKEVFIECSGHDLDVQMKAINMVCSTLADMGGKVYSIKMKYGKKNVVSPNLAPDKMKIDINYMNKILGLNLKENEMKKLLEKMGFGYSKGTVLIPCYRSDILHQIDFAEDIAIAYGYDNFKEEIPNVATIGDESFMQVFIRKLQEVLIGHGLIEVKNYNLSNKKVQNENMKTKLKLVEIENSLSEEYNVMRSWVTPCLLKTLSENKHREYPQNIFEVGTIFKGLEEDERIAVTLCDEQADYTRIKQILESLFESLGVKANYEETEHPSFIQGRVSRVSVKGKKLAYVGELHPEILGNFSLDLPVSCFELNLNDLMEVTK